MGFPGATTSSGAAGDLEPDGGGSACCSFLSPARFADGWEVEVGAATQMVVVGGWLMNYVGDEKKHVGFASFTDGTGPPVCI